MEEINVEIQHAAVLNRGLDRISSVEDEEGWAEGTTTYGTSAADGRGEDREDRVSWFGWKGWASSKWRKRNYDERKLSIEDELKRTVHGSGPGAATHFESGS